MECELQSDRRREGNGIESGDSMEDAILRVPRSLSRTRPGVMLLIALLLAGPASGQHRRESGGVSESQRLHALLDPIMEKSVADGNIPGGVLVVGHQGRVVYRRAFGSRSLEPVREPMTVDTIFDLASLTKCIATATSAMKLFEEGRIRLNDPVAAYLPEFAQNGKAGHHGA